MFIPKVERERQRETFTLHSVSGHRRPPSPFSVMPPGPSQKLTVMGSRAVTVTGLNALIYHMCVCVGGFCVLSRDVNGLKVDEQLSQFNTYSQSILTLQNIPKYIIIIKKILKNKCNAYIFNKLQSSIIHFIQIYFLQNFPH